jgi:hypothetical protein
VSNKREWGGALGAAAGAVYGYYTGNYSAIYYGFSIGYGVGAAVEKKPGMEGPRLEDLKFTSSQYGQPIPWLLGTPRVSGQIVWASDKREIATPTEAGKGGGPTNTSYTYEIDVLVMLCDHEAKFVTRIWSNGKLVWTRKLGAGGGSFEASDNTDQWKSLTFYSGAAAQLPDPIYEASVGVGNAPAYRGRATLMIEGLQLGGSGQLPNLTFELARDGAVSNTALLDAPLISSGSDAAADPATYTTNNAGSLAFASDGVTVTGDISNPVNMTWTSSATNNKLNSAKTEYNGQQFTVEVEADFLAGIGSGTGNVNTFLSYPAPAAVISFAVRRVSGANRIFAVHLATGDTQTIDCGVQPSNRFRIVFNAAGTEVQWYVGDTLVHSKTRVRVGAAPQTVVLSAIQHGNQGVSQYRFKNLRVYLGESPTEIYAPADVTLRSAVEAICARAGMPADTYDASALAAITQPVRSLAMPVGPSRPVIEQLATAFFIEAYLRDKLYFRPRGGAAAATIPWSDLAANADQPDDQSLPLSIGNHLELPPQASVTYINVNDDSQSGTEYSDRFTTGQAAVQSITLGLGLMPAEAKGIADAVVADTQAALVQGTVALPMTYAYLDPSDVVNVVDRDARTYRLRLGRKTDESGVLSFDVVADDALALNSIRTTDPGPGNAGTVTKYGDTVFLPLDIPLLRDDDNSAGYYVQAKGTTTLWPGGVIKSSADNVTFTSAAEINESAVFGACTTTLGNYTGVGFDEVNSVTINVGNGTLASSTRDAMLADQAVNAMMIGDEVIRFRSAVLVSAGVYTLTGLLRGQRGTEWAVATHAAAERAVLLRAAGMRRVSQNLNENGQLRYLRAGTLGAAVLPTTTNFTNTNRALKPLSPSDVRGVAQGGQRILLSWRRRSRLSTKLMTPSGLPLGESTESYIVRIYSLGPTTLKRTLTSTTASVAYERADQLADGITAGVEARVDVSQVSAAVGEGYVGSGTIYGAAQAVAQITQITLGGTFASGSQLYAQLGSTRVDYTTVTGDANLNGAATSFAAAIDATAPYAASAASAVITVTGPISTAYAVDVGTSAGNNTVTFSVAQTASPTVVGVSNEILINWGSPTGYAPPNTIGTLLVQRTTPALNLSVSGSNLGSPSTNPDIAVEFIADEVLNAWSNAGYAAAYGLLLVKDSGYGLGRLRLFTPATEPYNWTVQVFSSEPSDITGGSANTARGRTPATARPQIVEATFAGTPTTGWIYRVTLAGVNYSYTATGADTTMANIATGLAGVINGTPAIPYAATTVGAVLRIAHLTNNVPFTYSGKVISGTITVDAVITQNAA